MLYGIFRSMNNWQVEDSSYLWRRNHQRSGKRSRQRKPQKTKEKEKLHLFPQRLYSKALIPNRLHFIANELRIKMAPPSVSNKDIQGSNLLSTTLNVLKKKFPFYWHFETNSLLNFLSQWLFINFGLTSLRNQESRIQNMRMIIKIWQPWPCLWRYIGSWYHETWLILLSGTSLF